MNPSAPQDSDYAAAMTALQPGWLTGNGRYTLVQLLGCGGMGVVWLAEDEQLRERVALKFLPPEIGLSSIALEDLKRETARARKLTHPNIVRIHDFFKGEHEAFISMEFVDGAHLGNLRLDQLNEVFAWNDLQPLVTQLCEALRYAHAEGVIHRDIKPANLMVDRKGRLKLADFGFSARLADLPRDLPTRNATSGTVVYMSPNQLDGKTPEPADDIYSFGATLYELLTGQPPFSEGDIPHQIRNSLPAPITERLAERGIQREIPASVNALVMACLAKHPSQRPQSAEVISEWFEPTKLKADATPVENAVETKPSETAIQPDKISSTAAQSRVVAESPVSPTLPEVKNWPSEPHPIEPPSHRRSLIGLVITAFVGMIILASAGLFAWTKLQTRQATEIIATEQEITDIEPLKANEPSVEPLNPQPVPKLPPMINYETEDLAVSGSGFTVQSFKENGRAFANRKYIWQQVPAKFLGWNFTQTSGGSPAEIRVRAKRSTIVFAATASNASEINLSGWESDRSAFIYNARNGTRMAVVRKRLDAGEEMELPKGGWSGLILLLPK